MARRDIPVRHIATGPGGLSRSVGIYGHTADKLGIPVVEIGGDLEGLQLIRPETAEQLAQALLLAARAARGEVLPTVLDEFLAKRQA